MVDEPIQFGCGEIRPGKRPPKPPPPIPVPPIGVGGGGGGGGGSVPPVPVCPPFCGKKPTRPQPNYGPAWICLTSCRIYCNKHPLWPIPGFWEEGNMCFEGKDCYEGQWTEPVYGPRYYEILPHEWERFLRAQLECSDNKRTHDKRCEVLEGADVLERDALARIEDPTAAHWESDPLFAQANCREKCIELYGECVAPVEEEELGFKCDSPSVLHGEPGTCVPCKIDPKDPKCKRWTKNDCENSPECMIGGTIAPPGTVITPGRIGRPEKSVCLPVAARYCPPPGPITGPGGKTGKTAEPKKIKQQVMACYECSFNHETGKHGLTGRARNNWKDAVDKFGGAEAFGEDWYKSAQDKSRDCDLDPTECKTKCKNKNFDCPDGDKRRGDPDPIPDGWKCLKNLGPPHCVQCFLDGSDPDCLFDEIEECELTCKDAPIFTGNDPIIDLKTFKTVEIDPLVTFKEVDPVKVQDKTFGDISLKDILIKALPIGPTLGDRTIKDLLIGNVPLTPTGIIFTGNDIQDILISAIIDLSPTGISIGDIMLKDILLGAIPPGIILGERRIRDIYIPYIPPGIIIGGETIKDILIKARPIGGRSLGDITLRDILVDPKIPGRPWIQIGGITLRDILVDPKIPGFPGIQIGDITLRDILLPHIPPDVSFRRDSVHDLVELEDPTIGGPVRPTTFGGPVRPTTFGGPVRPTTFGGPVRPTTFGGPVVGGDHPEFRDVNQRNIAELDDPTLGGPRAGGDLQEPVPRLGFDPVHRMAGFPKEVGSPLPGLGDDVRRSPYSKAGGQATRIRDQVISVPDLAGKLSFGEKEIDSGHIYHTRYTFTGDAPKDVNLNTKPTEINGKYLDIFNDNVTPVVKYFIDRQGEYKGPWHESIIFALITENKHILNSINQNLLYVFDNLAYANDLKIAPEIFHNIIVKKLISKRIEEFDSSFYLSMYEKQKDNRIIQIIKAPDPIDNYKVALGMIAEEAIPADPDKYGGEEDIDYITNIKLPLDDLGSGAAISFSACNVDSSAIKFPFTKGAGGTSGVVVSANCEGAPVSALLYPGSGPGYYFKLSANPTIPLMMETDLSKTYITPITTLEKAITLFGHDHVMSLEVTSVADKSELDSSFTTSFTDNKIFCSLIPGTVKDDPDRKDNDFISEYLADYEIITDETKRLDASIEAGLLAMQINIHKDDPIRSYLSDYVDEAEGTKACSMRFKNIDFRNFLGEVSPAEGHIVARGLVPKVLVFVFSSGSKFLPIREGFSDIISISNDTNSKRRFVRGMPIISHPSPDTAGYALDRTLVFDEFGTYGIGLVGQQYGNLNTNKFFFKFDPDSSKYKDTFYKTTGGDHENDYTVCSTYTGDEPAQETPILRRVAKEIINETLRAKYYRKGFTWWDILSRLTLGEVGRMINDLPPDIWKDLATGRFTGGNKIFPSLNSDDEITGIITTKPSADDETIAMGVTDDPVDITDTKIIKATDRFDTIARSEEEHGLRGSATIFDANEVDAASTDLEE